MARESLFVRNGRHGFTAQVLVLLFAVLAPAATWAIPYVSNGSGDYHSPSTWSPTGIPGVLDSATILNGHVIDAFIDITVSDVEIQSGGTLIVQSHGVTLFAESVTVQPSGTLRGFDSATGGRNVFILPLSVGDMEVRNDGLIRGGNPSGSVFILDGTGSDAACTNNSKISSSGGMFLGGTLNGSIFMVAEDIDLSNAVVEGGSGMVPFNPYTGQSIAGNVYLGGVDIEIHGTLPLLTRVVSGTNTTPGGIAGTVKIVAYNCHGAIGSLSIGATALVDVGTPSVSSPGVLLFAAGTSTIFGTVGSPGASNSAADRGRTMHIDWDPPDLELLDLAEISGDGLTLVGENFHADLVGTGLRATDTIEIILAPGGVLDLRDLTPGPNYFEAGTGITLCADNILLQPGVTPADLMVPPPQICPGSDVLRLSLTPGSDHFVNPGDSVSLLLQAVNVGNAGGMVEVTLDDSAGWLAGGPLVFNRFLASGERISIAPVITVPSGSAAHTELLLTGQVTGQALQEERSTFVIEGIFADGFESGDTSAWSSVIP